MLSKNLNVLFLFLLAAMPAWSQFNQNQQESYVIADIYVEGNTTVSSETIIALSGLRIGSQLTSRDANVIQTAVRNIWNRGQFSKVDIIIDKIIPGVGIFLKIQVEEFPRLGEIIIEGNEEIDDEDLKKKIKKYRGNTISEYDVYLVEKRIKDYYEEEEGLAFAKVDIELEASDTTGYVNMLIEIDEGVEFWVRSIDFIGNEKFDDDDLAGALEETNTKSWWQFWSSDDFDKNKYEDDLDFLINYYKSEGYIDAEIVRDTVIYDADEEAVDLEIEVFEGNRVYIRNIEFEGNTVYPDYLLQRRLDFESGDIYNKELFDLNLYGNENQTDCYALYLDNGYLQARMEPIEKRAGEDSVDISINIYENDRFTMRKVLIKGNTKTKDKVIRRELYTHPGDYFDRSAIIRSVRALGVMQYFNPEALKPDVIPVDNSSVDVVYTVEERSTDTFNASIGFAGTFGLTGAIGFTFNNFSITEPLRGGAGQLFNFNWEFGQASRYQTFSLGFSEPWLFDTPTTVGFNLFDTRYNFYINQRMTGLRLNFGRRFKWPDDYWRGDWSFSYQFNDIGTTTRTSYLYYRPGKYREITVSQKFSRISINNMFFPSVGSNFSFKTSFAMGAIGLGETDYFKNELNFEIYNPLAKIEGSDRLVLYMGTKLGFIAGFENQDNISPIELYYMGGNGLSGFGVTPLRGYDDRSIGSNAGSRVQAKYTAELRFALSLDPMPIFIYGFGEAGNVWNDLESVNPFELKRSYGIGIQLLINPIGIVGFSYGYGVDPPVQGDEPSGWKFLFHFGQQY